MFTSPEPVALDTHRFTSPCALRTVDSEREYMRYVDGVFRSFQSNKGTSLRKGLAIIFEHVQSRGRCWGVCVQVIGIPQSAVISNA